VRPDFFRWIGLFPLDVRHLAERMFFAGTTQNERCSDQDSAKPKSHNALPQLSVSAVARKDESAAVGRDRPGAPNRSSMSMSKRIGQ